MNIELYVLVTRTQGGPVMTETHSDRDWLYRKWQGWIDRMDSPPDSLDDSHRVAYSTAYWDDGSFAVLHKH